MSYKYYTAGSPTTFFTPSQDFTNMFGTFIDQEFYNATDVFTVAEEYPFASGSMVNVDVRVNRAISSITGKSLGDDYKQLLFKYGHISSMGYKYYFDDNWWIVVQSEVIKSLAATCTVRRCNNLIRWVDNNGILYSEPCAVDYDINRPTDHAMGDNPILPEGFIRLYSQLNATTNLIDEGQRFLFGPVLNRRGYAVYGNGVKNFMNQKTSDDTSGGLLQLILGGPHQVNYDTDDIINGIADRYDAVYAVSIASGSVISGAVGTTSQISAVVTTNGVPSTSQSVAYATSASAIATVSGSGLVSLVSTGSANIIVSMASNTNIYDDVLVSVSGSATPAYEVRVSPTDGYILQGDTQVYTSFLYLDGTVQADVFSFTTSGSVPVGNYVFTVIGDNSFSVENVDMYVDSPLQVVCVSGMHSKTIDIELRGAW
jgi:hypothetical protein